MSYSVCGLNTAGFDRIYLKLEMSMIQQTLIHTQTSMRVVELAMMYLGKIGRGNETIIKNQFTPTQLLTTALILAHKFLSDESYDLVTWSHFTGVPVSALVLCELTCLTEMEYELYVSKIAFEKWSKCVVKRCKTRLGNHQ